MRFSTLLSLAASLVGVPALSAADQPGVSPSQISNLKSQIPPASGGYTDTYYLNDHLATTIAIIDARGIIDQVETTAFGAPLAAGRPATRYTGKPYDEDLGAYVFPFRNYRPEEARWMTPDPSGFPDGMNAFHYLSNPFKATDRLGLGPGYVTSTDLGYPVAALDGSGSDGFSVTNTYTASFTHDIGFGSEPTGYQGASEMWAADQWQWTASGGCSAGAGDGYIIQHVTIDEVKEPGATDSYRWDEWYESWYVIDNVTSAIVDSNYGYDDHLVDVDYFISDMLAAGWSQMNVVSTLTSTFYTDPTNYYGLAYWPNGPITPEGGYIQQYSPGYGVDPATWFAGSVSTQVIVQIE